MIQIDVWCPWVSSDRHGKVSKYFFNLLLQKRGRTQVLHLKQHKLFLAFLLFSFISLLCISAQHRLDDFDTSASYTLLFFFLLIEELHCLLAIVRGFSWFYNLDADPKYPWKNINSLITNYSQFPPVSFCLAKMFLFQSLPFALKLFCIKKSIKWMWSSTISSATALSTPASLVTDQARFLWLWSEWARLFCQEKCKFDNWVEV